MQKSDTNHNAVTTHRRTQVTSGSRRNLQRPTALNDSVKVSMKSSGQTQQAQKLQQAQKTQQTRKVHNIQKTQQKPVAPLQAAISNASRGERVDMSRVNERMRMRSSGATTEMQTAKQMKEEAIEKAMKTTERQAKQESQVKEKSIKMHFGFGRVMLALACATAAVFAIVYFVNLNAPDISLKVAAMQTGIEASYPSYVPRDYALSDITSEDGKIVLNFRKAETGDSFTLTEEVSSWDSNALLSNYVKDEYKTDYSVVKEQGLTLYISGSNACWVNGGVVYKINTTSGELTKKQIRSIAVSL